MSMSSVHKLLGSSSNNSRWDPTKSVNKPGTSCLGCRRRKLKCTREHEGCRNCTKADLPCVYPTPESGIKRKRGPYKKDKPARQRHLEDLVKYLEPKNDGYGSEGAASPSQQSSSDQRQSASGPSTNSTASRPSMQIAHSEALVKDALIALTRTSVSDHEPRLDAGYLFARSQAAAGQASSTNEHPSLRRILEYWSIYESRVDPVTKVIHCPSFAKMLFGTIDKLDNISSTTEALLFSMYYAAVSTCTARETRRRFGESQDLLLRHYGQHIETALSNNYDAPTLEQLQALVLHIICIRRQDNTTNLKALFTLAVRSAQIMGVNEDPEGRFPPYETELRRRLWYHLCGLENRTAEESGTRSASLMQDHNVQIPSNFNDRDLDPCMTEAPRPRLGVTEMTFPLLRFEVHRFIFGLVLIRRQQSAKRAGVEAIQHDQNEFLEQVRSRLQSQYIVYLHPSRPYDWMCLQFIQGMLIKAQMMIDVPSGSIPTKEMPETQRMNLLRASIGVIQTTHVLAIDERIADWIWYFRGYVQWHSLAIVVAELGCSTNMEFTDMAWRVMDPVLSDWDAIYKTRKDEPAWDHVNAMIERARRVRRRRHTHQNKAQRLRQTEADRILQELSPSLPMTPTAVPTHSQTPGYTSSDSVPADHRTVMKAHQAHMQQFDQNSTLDCQAPGSLTSNGGIMNFDIDFDNLDAFDIDFGAFDQVFNSNTWEMLSPLPGAYVPSEQAYQGMQMQQQGYR
ncbi:hypothetical protein DOTSEDRAFT_54348 [Dothistroma septosporum NZE10]|uniref:Zn(2)-C6 fungal-type domain-containing protein n=1 Tax=Dothistroma septosporum (strain NZE10 / CBS 128990) TaxID=675120 RepID=M2Y5Q1_DOTSN|nr:hypothetical protein DOTSEDRAFT_54348 [Dothistroma septosporum NZE10]